MRVYEQCQRGHMKGHQQHQQKGCSLVGTCQSQQGSYKGFHGLIRPSSTLVCTYKTAAFLLMDAILLTWNMENLEADMVFEGKINRSNEQWILWRLGMQAVEHHHSVWIVSVDGNPAASQNSGQVDNPLEHQDNSQGFQEKMFSCVNELLSSCVNPMLSARHQKPRLTREASQKIVMLASVASQQQEDRRWTPSEDSM